VLDLVPVALRVSQAVWPGRLTDPGRGPRSRSGQDRYLGRRLTDRRTAEVLEGAV